MFELNHVNYSYAHQIQALKDISLTINEGESVAIMGANGTGKSTLLKLIGGLIFSNSGETKAFDQVLTEKLMGSIAGGTFVQKFRQRVGILFQNSDTQLFCPTVYDEIAFGPLQLDVTIEEVKQRVEEVMEMLEIQNFRNRAPYTLSGGEKETGGDCINLAFES